MKYLKRLHWIGFSFLFVLLPSCGRVSLNTDFWAGIRERQHLVSLLCKITAPVLHAASRGELQAKMPVEQFHGPEALSPDLAYLQALARTLAGLAPWLELGPDLSSEGQLREKFIGWALSSISRVTDPNSAQYLEFDKKRHNLVDAAFLAQALLRAPSQLWGRLDKSAQNNVLVALEKTRSIIPPENNWVLFSAEIEAALMNFAGKGNPQILEDYLRRYLSWYKGDGVYGDGSSFHFDYYNSFVIHPMLHESMLVLFQHGGVMAREWPRVEQRLQRFAEIQERLISPEADFPVTGRSLSYRCGAFHALAYAALKGKLPANLHPAQVRAALYHLITRQMESTGTFDKNGWLTIGFAGHQPSAGEFYITTGSVYLCTFGFVMLGLPPSDPFWKGPDMKWTSRKAWDGDEFPLDHFLK